MGEEIAKTSFTPEDHAEFERRLAHETKLLGESLKAGRFSNEGFSLGFEVETWILDHNYFPLPVNAELLKAFDNEDAIPELSKFNVELTCPPRVLEGTVFSDARAAFETLLGDANEVARGLGGQLVMIGTLPTIREGDLTLDNLTPSKRFYALNTEVLRQRGGRPLRIDIEGEERLVSEHYDVMMEAGTTSFQVHLKTPVSVAHRYFKPPSWPPRRCWRRRSTRLFFSAKACGTKPASRCSNNRSIFTGVPLKKERPDRRA